MKKIWLLIGIVFSFSCNQRSPAERALQSRVDSLEKQLARTYKPGFGEFMTGIQAHHSKLWFAGQNQNWPLAEFEIEEIQETVADIQEYETDRPESKLIGMIVPAIDSVNAAIQQKNPVLFKSSFVKLTSTCNDCHRAAKFAFNVVKIPETAPFSNQDFKVQDFK